MDLSISSAVRAIASEANAPQALRKTLALLERELRPRSCYVLVHNPAEARLDVAVTRGRYDPRVVATLPGEGPAGRAYAAKTIVQDEGLLAVPMLAGDEPVGVVVCLGGAELRAPLTDERKDSLLAMAQSAAMVVALAQSREEAERRGRDLRLVGEQLDERARLRDSVLSHLSHELRTPLTTIKLYLEMAQKGKLGEFADKQRDAILVCQRNTDRLLRLVNDLLLAARLDQGQMALDPRPLGLRSVLAEALALLQDDLLSSGIATSIELPEGEVFVRGNRDRLVEAFMHFLERGLGTGRAGRELRVEIRPRDRKGSLRIVHEGLELPEEEIDQIFTAFRPDGGRSNLGLNIARQVIQLHGGIAQAGNAPEGLWFEIRFPLYAGAVATGARGPGPRQGEILVVEDDDDCRNGIVDYLSAERFSVRAFSDGQDALERIREIPPALLLVDLRLPGVDGARLIREVREGAGPSTPIYVISGAIDDGLGQEEAWGAKVDGVFEKPINFPYLLERVREYVSPI